MPDNRFYLPEQFSNDKRVVLKGQESHHLSSVMRVKSGDIVELVNGKNALAKGKVISADKAQTTLEILSVEEKHPPSPQIILAQALLRPNRLELVIEKGTELGISSFALFPSKNSELSSLSENKRKRIYDLAIGALKQCGRLDLPTITFLDKLSELKTLGAKHLLLADPSLGKQKLNCYISDLGKTKDSILLLIGPEKGWHNDEIAFFIKELNATPVLLHENVLRAETAALCAASLATAAYSN